MEGIFEAFLSCVFEIVTEAVADFVGDLIQSAIERFIENNILGGISGAEVYQFPKLENTSQIISLDIFNRKN